MKCSDRHWTAEWTVLEQGDNAPSARATWRGSSFASRRQPSKTATANARTQGARGILTKAIDSTQRFSARLFWLTPRSNRQRQSRGVFLPAKFSGGLQPKRRTL